MQHASGYVWASCGCHNKLPWADWLRQQKCILLWFWRETQKIQIKASAGPHSLWRLQETVFFASSSFWWLTAYLGYWLHHSNLCLDGHIVSWSVFSSVCLRTLVTGRRSYPHNPGSSPHLKIFVQLFAMPWTVAYKAALSMEFFRQEYWSGLPFPFPGDLPDPGIESRSPTLQADDLPSEPRGKPTVISAETSVSK